MGVKLVSVSGGSVEINPPATASNFVATMPAGTGNVVVNGVNGALVSGTAVASTSGTSIDFTGIPSWVKRITVMFSGVSTNGNSIPQVQLGSSGGVETSSYIGSGISYANGNIVSASNNSSGFLTAGDHSAAAVFQGAMTITLISTSSNLWCASGTMGRSNTASGGASGGSKTLSGTLDRVRITTVNGTDTFDAGSINILYE
jgi:hypothetical protein